MAKIYFPSQYLHFILSLFAIFILLFAFTACQPGKDADLLDEGDINDGEDSEREEQIEDLDVEDQEVEDTEATPAEDSAEQPEQEEQQETEEVEEAEDQTQQNNSAEKNETEIPLTIAGLPMSEAQQKARQSYQQEFTGFGFITVNSTPSKAIVYLGSERVGNTPITHYRVKHGPYLLRVDLPGHDPFSKQIYIHDQQETTAVVKLSAYSQSGGTGAVREGSLNLTSVPNGITVFLDNIYKGDTPLLLKEIPQGDHELKLRKLGYKEYVATIHIYAGVKKVHHVDMKSTG